jgi:hypothetical protein
MQCPGNTEDHCCYLNGQRWHFLEENTVPGRRWACGLFREHGNWQAVHVDPRYLQTVRPQWQQTPLAGQECGEWPRPGVTCPVCQQEG